MAKKNYSDIIASSLAGRNPSPSVASIEEKEDEPKREVKAARKETEENSEEEVAFRNFTIKKRINDQKICKTIYIDSSHYEKIKKIGEETGLSVSGVINEIFNQIL